jgi:hypothetical protein
VRGALSIRCVFEVCELGGGEYGFTEWLSDGRFEFIVPLLCGRFALGGRSNALLLDVLLLLGGLAGRKSAFELFDDLERFSTGRFPTRMSVGRVPAERFSAARFPAGLDARACFGDIAGAW